MRQCFAQPLLHSVTIHVEDLPLDVTRHLAGLTDGVFDASTLSQNRRRRFNDTSIAQDIFDAIVEQAVAHKLVEGLWSIN